MSTEPNMPTVMITGANRGLGKALAVAWHAKGWTVIAAVRDVRKMDAKEGMIVVKLDADSWTDAKDAVQELQTRYGIHSLDVVLANAAIYPIHDPFETVDPAIMQQMLNTNVIGPLVLFQAVRPLLQKGSKYIILSSVMSQLSPESMDIGGGAYSLTKTACNYLARKLHFENPDLVVMALVPGWLATDMGTKSTAWVAFESGPLPVSHVLPHIVRLVERACKELESGRLVNWDGQILQW